jgi:hypothetical protein
MVRYKKWAEIKKENFSPEEIAASREWAEQKVIELNLKAVRKMTGVTQGELAKATKLAQSDISVLENRGNHLIETIRRYIEALGGELEIIARFGDKSIRLRGV